MKDFPEETFPEEERPEGRGTRIPKPRSSGGRARLSGSSFLPAPEHTKAWISGEDLDNRKETIAEMLQFRCPACFREEGFSLAEEGETPRVSDCPGCGIRLDPFSDGENPHPMKPGMEDGGTGIRNRFRGNLGFRPAGREATVSAARPDADGAAVRRGLAVWLDNRYSGWDAAGAQNQPAGKQWKSLVVLGALLGFGGLTAFGLWSRHAGPPPVLAPSVAGKTAAGVTPEDAFSEKFTAASGAARVFLGADSVEKLLPLVRDPQRVEPLIRAWYQFSPPFTAPLKSVTGHSGVEARGHVFVKTIAESDKGLITTVTMEETAEGWKADWESFVAWSELSWPQLAESDDSKREPVLMRGYLSLNEQYERPFRPATHQGCVLRSPDLSVSLAAWMERDARAVMLLRGAIFDAKAPQVEIIVRVRPAPGGTKGRLEIVEILQTGWVLWRGSRPDGKSIFLKGN